MHILGAHSIIDVRKCYMLFTHCSRFDTNISFHTYSACLTFMQKRCENYVEKEWNRVRSESRDRHVEHLLLAALNHLETLAGSWDAENREGVNTRAHARTHARRHKRARAHKVCNSTANMSPVNYRKCMFRSNCAKYYFFWIIPLYSFDLREGVQSVGRSLKTNPDMVIKTLT